MTAPILVLGGTGHLGRHVVAALRQRDLPVRVLSRDAQRARELLGDGVQIHPGDLCDPAALGPAMAGVERAVVAVSAMSPATFRRAREIEHDAVIAALQRGAGDRLRRVVLISIFDIDLELAARLGIANARIKHDLERWLRDSSLNWTVLGQPPSMDIFFSFIRGDETMIVPGGGPPLLPTIAPQDTGAVAARAVLRDDLGGQRIRLVGATPCSFPEAARRIGQVWGRELRFQAIPLFIPMALRFLLTPLASLNDRLGHARELLGYARLLNTFPGDPEQLAEDRRRLAALFDHPFATLEEEAARRRPR